MNTIAEITEAYNEVARKLGRKTVKGFKDKTTALARYEAISREQIAIVNAEIKAKFEERYPAHEEAHEDEQEATDEASATHAEAPAESEPAAILAAPSEDQDGPVCSSLMDTSADDEEKAAIRLMKAEAKYSPTNPDNIARAAFYNFVSVEAYINAIRAKHTYKKAVTAGADNVAELKAIWQAAERSGKGGRKVKVHS